MSPGGLLLLLFACALENGLGSKSTPPFDTGVPQDSGADTGIDTSDVPPEELCNGLDDDGDGEVDEGFPDDDGNGRADCMDEACPPLTLPGAGEVASVCGIDPWDVTIEWQATMRDGSYTPPLVGHLVDTDGDGDVDDADLPVVVVGDLWGTLGVYAGDGSGLLFTVPHAHAIAAGALADVDGDGRIELVIPLEDGSVAAVDGTGTRLWTSPAVAPGALYPTLSLADLDGDGTTEVITPTAVLAGADGSLLLALPFDVDRQVLPTVVDLDQDGTSEILLGRAWYRADGSPLYEESRRPGVAEFNAVVDADGDGRGDVITVSQSRMTLQTPDGALVWDIALPGTREPGPPAIADFDGDGQVEICVPDDAELGLYELDGSLTWAVPMSDFSGWAGCAGFDGDADGVMEVLFAGESFFRIHDGRTGATLYEDPKHRSGTAFEYPVVADVDGDGSAEIVVIDNFGGYDGVTVYGHVDDAWPTVGETWGVYDLPLSAIAADGSVPSPAPAPWVPDNRFHARSGTPQVDPPANLRVVVDDGCVADCVYGPVLLGLHVENAGDTDVPAGTLVALRRGDGTRITELALDAIPARTALAGVSVTLAPADVAAGPVTITVDDDGTGAGQVTECDETDNVAAWDAGCPP